VDDDQVIGTAGEAERMALAGTAFVARLWQDPRTEAVYQDCRPFLESRLLKMEAGRVDMADRTADTIRQRFQLLATQLGLTYEWLAEALYIDATARFLAEFTGLPFLKFNLEAPTLPKLQSRRPRGDGSYIARDVDWYYRTEIQVPPETSYSIAKTEIPFKGKQPNQRQVDTAIERTKALLARFALGDRSS
jgi:hypothetical protein